MNLALLETLRARRGEWCRARALAAHLFIAPEEVRRDLQALRRAGYLIESTTGGRFRFVGVADRLIPYEITRALGTSTIGKNVVSLGRVGSTNDEAWERFCAGAPEGTAVLAEAQAAGRGRFGRRWLCPHGAGVLMSCVLCPAIGPERASALTVMGAVAAADVLNEQLGVPALIRWPNDVVVRGKKVGGVLVESRSQPGRGAGYVLGLGLNVNISLQQMPEAIRHAATSLNLFLGRPLDRIALARALLRALERWYFEVQHERYGILSQQWRQYSSILGERIVLEQDGRRFAGRVLDLSIEEGLILQLDHGGARLFDSASVTVVSDAQG